MEQTQIAPAVSRDAGLRDAHVAYKRAGDALAAATKAAYPPGCVVEVTLGKSRILGEVLSAGHWSDNYRADVTIRNLKTGKRRHFSATYAGHNARVIQSRNTALNSSPTT